MLPVRQLPRPAFLSSPILGRLVLGKRQAVFRRLSNGTSLRPTRLWLIAALLGFTTGALVWLWPSVSTAQEYIEPGTSAPGGSVAPPLNAGTGAQFKAGSLIIGLDGGTSQLCLNATGSVDPDNCVSSWTALTSQLGGPFVSLRQDSFLSGENPLDNQAYQSQSGFARIRSIDDSQAFSTLVQAAQYCIPDDPERSSEGRCAVGGDLCRENFNCSLPGGVPALTTGLFASDSDRIVSSVRVNDAAVFGGRFFVFGSSINVPVNLAANLCLNGTGPGGIPSGPNCIYSWDTITGGALTGYVKLQANPPAEEQLGSSWVSGVGQISTVIAGDPTALKAADRPYTCGDGLCTAAYETAAACPVDCAAVPQVGMQAAWGDFGTEFTIAISGTTFPAELLIVRADGNSISFTPQLGRAYANNQLIGNVRVVFAGQVNVQSPAIPDDNPGLCGRNYTYLAFQGNLFPRYGSSSPPVTITSCS